MYIIALRIIFRQVCGFEEYLLGDYPLIQYKVCDSLPRHVCTCIHVHCTYTCTCSYDITEVKINSSQHHTHVCISLCIYTVYSSCCGQRQQSSTVPCAQNISTNRVHQGRFPHAFTAKKGEAQKERLVVTYVHVRVQCRCSRDSFLVLRTPCCRYYQYLVHCWKTASEDCQCRKSERFKRHFSE